MYEGFRKSFTSRSLEFTAYPDLTEEQKRLVLECRNSEEVRKWMCSTDPIPLEGHLAFIERLKSSEKNFYWAVFGGKEGEFLGGVSLVGLEDMSADSGIFLNPKHIGSGLGFRISVISIDYYFRTLGLKSIYSVVHAQNAGAIAMNKRLGCVFGREQNGFLPVSLSAEQWDARRDKLVKMLSFL